MTTAKGGQKLAGSVKWLRNKRTGKPCWHARFTMNDKTRSPYKALDPSIPYEDEARARECARDIAETVRKTGLVPEMVRETTREWFTRFHKHKEGRGLSTVEEMRGRYRKWIDPAIGLKDPRAVTREDLEGIVRRLDKAIDQWIKHEGKRGPTRISPSTAANVWGDLVHAFDEMVRSKDPGLRMLTSSPCTLVRGPEAGDDRSGQILYSDEIVALLRGIPLEADGKPVPLYRRQSYAMFIYTKTRSSELEAVTTADVDKVHGTIGIAKQANRKSKGRKETKRTKTKKVRTIDIEPNLLALVEYLVEHPQGKGGRLVHLPPPEDRAELLRKDLWTVGVRREALHRSDELQRAIVLHDLRDTGLTHMAVRGDSPIAIQWTGGHTDFKTTQGYIDRGKVDARRIGTPLPPLPPGLIPPESVPSAVPSFSRTAERKYRKPLVFSRPQRELNPCYRRERPVS